MLWISMRKMKRVKGKRRKRKMTKWKISSQPVPVAQQRTPTPSPSSTHLGSPTSLLPQSILLPLPALPSVGPVQQVTIDNGLSASVNGSAPVRFDSHSRPSPLRRRTLVVCKSSLPYRTLCPARKDQEREEGAWRGELRYIRTIDPRCPIMMPGSAHVPLLRGQGVDVQ